MNRGTKFSFLFFRNITLKSANFKNKRGLGVYALLSVPIATFCLGTWQIKRRAWKLNLIEEVKKKHSAPPIPLPENLSDLLDMEYCQLKIRGTFDHSKEMYIGPRQLLTSDNQGSGGIFSGRPQSGSLVVTPFYISDHNCSILVNRGWVPKAKLDPSKRSQGQVEGEVDIIATVRLQEERPQFSPKQLADSCHFYFRDVQAMARMAGTAPIFVDAGRDSTVAGGPVGGQTRLTFRNDHLSYIVTWYAMSAVTSVMWYRRFFSLH